MSNEKTQSGPTRKDPEFDIRTLRKEIVLYCHDLPDLIRLGGADFQADMALTLGKCFCWIDHTFRGYDHPAWTLNHHQEITVGSIGQKLWDLGKELARKRGTESPIELQLARLNLRLRSLEQIVLRMGGPAR
jgi:hypothetical protein